MTPCTQQSHIVDSRFYRKGYTTDEARKIFCDLRRFQRWLDVEATMASCQADLGMIPRDAAQAMTATAHLSQLDLAAVQRDIETTGHSLIPLLRAWQMVAPPEAGQFINYGATTQDIQDTALVMELRDVFAIITRDSRELIEALCRLAARHRKTVTIGRTHGQPALPTTFGYKVAIWIDEMIRAMDRLDACRQRLLAAQLFGGVGTMDAFGVHGDQLLQLFAERLDLGVPLTAWHSARDRQCEFLTASAMLAGCLGKIANELYTLSRSEVAEVEEPFHLGKIGSTTMPHKRNPELCEQSVVLARLIMGNAATGFSGLISEHERDYRAVRIEWAILTDTSLYLCGQLAIMKKIMTGLTVHEEQMKQNAATQAAHLTTEALMLELGKRMGKQNAHAFLYHIAMTAHEQGRPLEQLLMDEKEITKTLTPKELRTIMDPARHTGAAASLTDKMVQAAKKWQRQRDKTPLAPPAPCPLADTKGACTIAGL